MTGQDLLYGLSFVDERFVAEADTAVLGRKIPWMKVLSVAACLCILIAGAFALENMGLKGATEEAAPAAAAPEAMQESAMEEAAPTMPADMITESAEVTDNAPGELQHIPTATLRIVKVLEDGSFEAVVEEVSDEPMALVVDMRLQMTIDPDMVPDGATVDGEYADTITQGMLVEIRDGAYDADTNTLYVGGIFAVAE